MTFLRTGRPLRLQIMATRLWLLSSYREFVGYKIEIVETLAFITPTYVLGDI